MSDLYEKPLTMPPVIGGAGSDGGLPDQKDLTLPPIVGGSGAGMAGPPEQRPLTLPPTV